MNQRSLAGMIDVSVLKPDNDERDVAELITFAKEKHCIAVFTLPSFSPLAVQLLDGTDGIEIGGVVGFPSGGDGTADKAEQTKRLIAAGCTEIDMVINVGMVKAGRYDYVLHEIQQVIEAADGAPVKTIFECHYLNNDEIRKMCEIGCRAGVAFVKTGTGWAPTGATVENVSLMKSVVGDAVGIKAAGGVKDLTTLLELHRCGAERFGIGLASAKSIFREFAETRQ